MTNGANQALRGYRRQTLYALSRVIGVRDNDDTFQLELYEDFAVVDQDGKPLEIVQVKDYSDDLNFSTLRDFFYRTAIQLRSNPNTSTKVVSFGSVGPELDKAWQEEGKERERVREKLSKKVQGIGRGATLTEADIDRVFSSVEIVKVDEGTLESEVFAFLNNTLAGGQPNHAFELLQAWLLRLSEKSARVTYGEVLDRLTNVGKYLRAREEHHQQWFTSVKPLEDELVAEKELDLLREDFYQGINTKYRHVLGNIDAVRAAKLQKIRQGFDASNVVIVHGASGQGKSTLAYRYLHDYVPSSSRFEIVAIEDSRHALDIARALSGHFQAIGTEMYVYIDAQPSNNFWTQVVQELSEYSGLKLLITVREEDFRRIDTPGTALGLPETIELTFTRAEGEEIYQDLAKHRAPEHILGFEEAWERFGSSGPLLEFVYLVTQNESLRERLAKQVKHLEDEVRRGDLAPSEFDLLRVVAAASAYGTRLDLAKLIKRLGLTVPKATVERYEKEYLLRTSMDGRYIEGLHSLRSTILTDLLTDPVLQPWHEVVEPIIKTAVESDLEAFLLFAFSRRLEAKPHILDVLMATGPVSWSGASAILKGLFWLGVREHVEKDRDVIDKTFAKFNQAWWMTLDCDLVGISEGKMTSWIDALSDTGVIADKAVAEAHALRVQQTSKEGVFSLARAWLKILTEHVRTPDTVFEWLGFANVAFWLGYFHEGDAFDLVPKEALNDATETLPLENLADVILALSNHVSFQNWFPEIREKLLNRFQEETKTIYLEDDGNTIHTHFIVDLAIRVPGIDEIQSVDDLLSMNLESLDTEESESSPENLIHSETMRRVRLLRRLIPDRNEYGSRGYGHRWASLEMPFDETEKNISTDHLLPGWATQTNGFYSRLGVYSRRSGTWKEYAEPEIELRRHVVTVLSMLQKALESHFRKATLVDINSYINFAVWDVCLSALRHEVLIPKVAVDEWGFTSESKVKEIKKKVDANHSVVDKLHVPVALTELRRFLEYRKKLFQGVQNFFPQALHVFKVNTFRVRRTDLSLEERERMISESKLKSDLDTNSQLNLNDAYLALHDYQAEFRKRFGHFFDGDELTRLEKREAEVYKNVWCLWHQIVDHPNRRMQEPLPEARARTEKVAPQLKKQIERGLRALVKERINARLLSADATWDKQSVLWIAVDSEPLRIYEDILKVLEALRNTVGETKYGSIKQITMERLYEQVCILPLVEGRLIAPAARRISSNILFTGSVFEGQDWWNQIFHPLEPDVLAALQLDVWNDPRLDITRRLSSLVANLYVLVAHLSDFNRVSDIDAPEESSEKAIEITQPYLERRMKLINDVLQAAIDTEVELCAFYENITEIDSLLLESVPILRALHENVMPQPGKDSSEEKPLQLSVSAMPEWLTRLEQATQQTELIHLAWLEHVRHDVKVA